MGKPVRTWKTVARQFSKNTGKPITRMGARKIGIRAENKLRRALLEVAVQTGILTEADAEIWKEAMHVRQDHALCERINAKVKHRNDRLIAPMAEHGVVNREVRAMAYA